MTSSCQHLEKFKKNNLIEFSCLYSCLIACTSEKALHATAVHSICSVCKNTWKLHACLYCVFIGCHGNKHIHQHLLANKHSLSVDLNHGYVYCIFCNDFMYDTELDNIARRCKQKAYKLLGIREPYYPWVPSDYEVELLHETVEQKQVRENSHLGIRGLCNLGNSCYISAVLQSIIHTPLVRDYFFSLQHICEPPEDEQKAEPCILCELSLLFQEFYSGSTLPYPPYQLYVYFWNKNMILREQKQMDAQEFLDNLLNEMQVCCRGVNDSRSFSSNKYQNIVDVFTGWFQSDITCEGCKDISTTVEPFWSTPLDIELPSSHSGSSTFNGMKETESSSLEFCLERFTEKEELSATYDCKRCKMTQKCLKQLTFKTLPNVMCFQLKRFEKYLADYFKIETYVSFPQILDMTEFLCCFHKDTRMINGSASDLEEYCDNKFRLYAVIYHHGELDKGHYTAFIRQCGDQWFKCDDHSVSLISTEEVLQLKAYMLFYHKDTLLYE